MNQQQEQTQTQRHLTILNAIDKLSAITAETDEGKEKIINLYDSYKNIVSRFIQEKSQLDDSAKTLYDRLSFSGVESLSKQDLDSLRRLMFSALIIEEGKLFQTKEKIEGSRPDLMFGETLMAINEGREQAKRKKQEKDREFIEQLVLQYGSALRLSPEEQKSLQQTLLQQAANLRKTYGDRVIPESVYIQEVKKAIQRLKPLSSVRLITFTNPKTQSLYEKAINFYEQGTLFSRQGMVGQPTITTTSPPLDNTHTAGTTAFQSTSYEELLRELGNELLVTVIYSKIPKEKINQLRIAIANTQIEQNGVVVSPDEYIEKITTILSHEPSLIPKDYELTNSFKEIYQRFPNIQSIYQEVESFYREERTYELLAKEIVRKQKDLAIRDDLRIVYAPFVALEAATHVLLKTSPPNIPPEEIIEKATALGNVFVGYQIQDYPNTSEDIARLIQESIGSRYGDIVQKQSIELIDKIIGPPSQITEESKKAMLYEFIRADIQRDLLQIIENKELLQRILTNNGNGPMTSEAFQLFVQSPLFAFIEQTIKQQSNQQHGGGIGGLFQIVSSAQGLTNLTPETNAALSFIFTAGDLVEIQRNEELYNRFISAFPELSKDGKLPKTPQEAFFALVFASVYPNEQERFFETIKESLREDPSGKFYHLGWLNHMIDHLKKEAAHRLLLLSKPYITNILRLGRIDKLPFFLGKKIFGSIGRGLVKIGIGKVASLATKSALFLTGPVGAAIETASRVLDMVKILAIYIFGDVSFIKKGIESISIVNIIVYILGGILLGVYFFSSPQSNPVLIEQKIIQSSIDDWTLTSGSKDIPMINCSQEPTNPVCSICYTNGQRDPTKCIWPVSSGCITQGPNPNHKTEPNGQGVDIATEFNTPIRAMFPGRVIEARWHFVDNQKTENPNYGNMVRIKTSTNPSFIIVYAHLRQTNTVQQGDTVTPDTIIGYVDNTGYGTGTHLHMEIQGVPAGNVLPFPVPPCVGLSDCSTQISNSGNSSCW